MSEIFLPTPHISVHLPHRCFFLPMQYKYKSWQNAVLGMDKIPHTYSTLLLQWVTCVTQELAQRHTMNMQNHMGTGASYLLF